LMKTYFTTREGRWIRERYLVSTAHSAFFMQHLQQHLKQQQQMGVHGFECVGEA